MSSKINVCEIISGHFNTLRNADTKKLSFYDILTFIVIPIFISIGVSYSVVMISKDLVSLLVNFSAILTALLLSVLVLVYDQETKIREKKDTDTFYPTKKKLLQELYYNICYSIVCGVILVVFCFLVSLYTVSPLGVISGNTYNLSVFDYNISFNFVSCIYFPIIIFLAIHLILNILMIVKRMHSLLTLD